MKRPLHWAYWALAVLVALLLLTQLWFFGWVLWWKHADPVTTSFMELRLTELRRKRPDAELQHQWVPYERISVHLKRAVVAAEDDRFMEHYGFDWEGIQRALERNKERGRTASGGSTITQQLAKNLFLSPSRSYLRKAQEAVLTVMIESTWSKRRVFEVYLNVVEWGDGVFGAEAAARHHFGLSASRLGPAEAARLAVMLPNPRRYERRFGAQLAAHAERVRARMHYSRIP
ncbi:monofunctional biosynthetic peptidoglycan transglycosylase [Pseudothauera rhizosphaerae]|uniref:Biosynthetic peptidoglycan transglycosylase n=1 Tax=Pseudothauera rhizosphaerae TaxID=2565932 RepID=A0A4S4A9J0_9RHOO|nr:monofunctional biosynthetic peptidoglycan transglycosylase [Pseudothauera rhizosphaerae]THF54793.1 monofunctional biosynthetic peptidoglycan transglycosylase [Pseudothauera rhizosphaerae]